MFATLIKAKSQKTVPWKNGKGVTTEVAIEPPGAGLDQFLWRLSSAPVNEPGPFSLFPGYDRLLVLVKGTALVLRRASSHRKLTRDSVVGFPGEEEIHAELPEGPIQDLGLIFNRERVSAQVFHLKFPKPRSFELRAQTSVFWVGEGKFLASVFPGDHKFRLGEGDALRIESASTIKDRLVLFEPESPTDRIIGWEIQTRTNVEDRSNSSK